MGVFPDFDGLGGIGDLCAVVGALLIFVLIIAVLMPIVSAIVWAIATASKGPLLVNCADTYTRCGDANRRLCNQALFTMVYIDEDNELRVEHNRPFGMLLDPQVNANALTWVTSQMQKRPEPSPTETLAKVRALRVGWAQQDSNL